MDVNKILSTDLLDLIFEGRNKDYGAYELRKQYNRRLTKALVITFGGLLLIFLTSFLVNAAGYRLSASTLARYSPRRARTLGSFVRPVASTRRARASAISLAST